jgi:hypothetical protein
MPNPRPRPSSCVHRVESRSLVGRLRMSDYLSFPTAGNPRRAHGVSSRQLDGALAHCGVVVRSAPVRWVLEDICDRHPARRDLVPAAVFPDPDCGPSLYFPRGGAGGSYSGHSPSDLDSGGGECRVTPEISPSARRPDTDTSPPEEPWRSSRRPVGRSYCARRRSTAAAARSTTGASSPRPSPHRGRGG